MFIGVVGRIASGKEVFAEYLIQKHGFVSFSLSTILHHELKKRKVKKFTRETLQDIGDELRRRYGEAVLAKKAVAILKKDHKQFIITGIRNPAEIKFLRKLPNFILVAIKTDQKIRFKRLLKRAKPWDPKNWSEFLVIDRRDKGIGQKKSGQQVGKCIKLADYSLANDTGMKSFHLKIKRLYQKLT